jgi:cytochrome c
MDSFEANKIFGAVLGTIFVLFGGSLLAEGLFHAETPETPGFEIVVAEAEEGAGEAAAEEEAVPIAALLQTADADAGASEFRKCSACHTAEQGGANRVGPHLWGVVDRPIASVPDFSYSAALQEFSEGGSVVWDYDHLSYFIEDPKGHVPGTAMGFAGLRDPEARANVIAYLRTLSENPAPLPDAPVAEAAPVEAAAEVTEPGTSTLDAGGADAQAPAVTDTEAAQPLPGAEAAPVQSPENREETPATVLQDANEPPVPTGGDTTAPAAEGTAPEGAVSVDPGQGAAAPAAVAAPDAAIPPAITPDAPPAAAPAAPPAAAPAVPPAAAPAADEAAAQAAEEAAAPAAEPVALAGDVAAGQSVFRKCQACHAIGEGAVNKIGPELNGIIGEAVASVEGYAFSPALTAFAEEHPVWTPELMAEWLENPRQLVPGTKMVFPGIRDADDLANVIAYLASFDETGAQQAD